MTEQRKELEREYPDQRERDHLALAPEEFLARYPNKRFYAITRRSKAYMEDWLRREVPGRKVLEYCCGLGGSAIALARMGGEVWGIDISGESIRTAQRKSEEAGLGERTTFAVMDAEQMDFPDDHFDVIVCRGVLHHLDLEHAYPELARVLKPGGKVIAQEALGYNPAINAYRRLTPHLRTAWEIDHILRLKDVARARRHFHRAEVRYFHLAEIAALAFHRTPLFGPVLRALGALDAGLLRIPLVQRMAWQMIFVLSDPKKPGDRAAG